MSPKTSWKDVIVERQKESFVGRKDYIKQFTENFASDIPNYLLFFVIGEGGVGKSTLLKQFEAIGKNPEIDAIVITCDDEQSSPVTAMGYIAEQLAKFDINSKEFNERYKTYRTRRDEVESDPKAPRGALNLVVRGMTDFAIKAVRRAPGIGVFAEYVDEKEAGDALTQGVNYLVDRIGNKDEIQLLREPEKTLTPLFIELINKVCEEHRLVLMFDVFERTREALEPWLLEFLDFKFGEFDTGTTFVISGRDTVDQRWTQIASSICYITLEPFTLEETRSYLLFRKITNKQLVAQIFEDTGGLPVLVELLAGTNPKPGSPLPDISKDAVKRFLQWIPEEERRWVALLAAVPRNFSLDTLNAALGKDARNDFNWLSVQSYIRTSTVYGWFYHEKVRELMLRYLRKTNPSDLTVTHERLVLFFEAEQNKLKLNREEAFSSETWRVNEVERVYHLVCENPKSNFKEIINTFLEALRWEVKFAGTILQISRQASHELDSRELRANTNVLEKFYQSSNKNDYEGLVTQANILTDINGLSEIAQSTLLTLRGEAYRRLGKTEQALADCDKAIGLDEKFLSGFIIRGRIYVEIDKYDEAIADFSGAIAINNKHTWALAHRGDTYRLLGKTEDALKDLDLAISLNKKFGWAFASRGVTYREIGKYEQAIADFDNAISTNENYLFAIAHRGETYRLMGKYEQAVADFDRAISLDEKYLFAIASRGQTYQDTGKLEQALTEFEYAISLDSKYIFAIASHGELLEQMGNYEQALADFNRVIEINSQHHWAYEHRGSVLRELKRYEEAVDSLNQAEQLKPTCAVCHKERGETYEAMGKYDLALSDFNNAITINDKYILAIASRGKIYEQMGRHLEALTDFERAIDLDNEYHWAYEQIGKVLRTLNRYSEALDAFTKAEKIEATCSICIAERGETYRQMGKDEQALTDFDHAIELDNEYHWAYEKRGIVLRNLNRYVDALVSFDQAEKTGPTCTVCIIERGRTYLQMKRIDEALMDFNHALEREQEDSWCYYQRFLVYYAMSQKEDRDKDIANAIRLATVDREKDPDNKANTCNLALFYLAAGKTDQSELLYQEVLSSDMSLKLIRECIEDLRELSGVLQENSHADAIRLLFEEKLKAG